MKPFANRQGYSDVEPFEVVSASPSGKTIELRPMKAKLAEGEKPKFLVGGFCGHCVNQRELKYDISSNPSAPTIKARLHKDGSYHSRYGRHVLSDKPIYFYDYDF